MNTSRLMSWAALAATLAAAAVPAPASAQLGGLIKRKLKEKIVQTVGGTDTATTSTGASAGAPGVSAVKKGARTAPPKPGPTFSEYTLEMTPELLDRLEKGLAAEEAVQQEIDRLIGKVLPHDEFERCRTAVITSPEGQKVYEQSAGLLEGDRTQAQLQKASEELARRFDRLTEPKCGLDSQKAQAVRDQHAERLAAAAPQASGLTPLQLSIMKERIIPLCAAAEALAAMADEVRIPTGSEAIFWVYSPGEVQALQPRCAKLTSALRAGA